MSKVTLKYKVEEVKYGKSTEIHYFQNKAAAKNAARQMLSQGHGANLFKRDKELDIGWSKLGSYIPDKQRIYDKDIYYGTGVTERPPRLTGGKGPRITPKRPTLRR